MPLARRIVKRAFVYLAAGAALVATAPVTSTASAETTSTTTTTSTSTLTCNATLTATGGTPWRRGSCTTPGYSNVPIKSSPVLDSSSTRVVSTLPGAMLNYDEYGEPIYFSSSTTPLRRVTCTTYACAGGTQARVDGAWRPARGSDGQLAVVDLAARRTYEFWRVERDGDGTVKVNSDGSIRASHMSVAALDGRGNTTPAGGKLGVTGAGVSRMFGIITKADVAATLADPSKGIRHALQLSLPSSKNCATYRAPATKSDGRGTSNCVPEGARVQMDPSVNCATIAASTFTKGVCYALRTYGGYTMDNNGSDRIAIYGQTPASTGGTIAYRSVGVTYDYQALSGLPISKLRVLRSWDGS